MTRRLYLVRHGEVHNPTRVRYGCMPGFLLSDEGVRQARSAAQWLAEQEHAPTALYASPLERAAQTAEALGAALHLEPRFDPRLREASSVLDGLPRRAGPVTLLLARLRGQSTGQRESPLLVVARMRALVSELLAGLPSDGAAVCVSHQAPLRLLVTSLLFDAERARLQWPYALRPWRARPMTCSPGSVTVLRCEPASFVLEQYREP